MKLTLRVIVLGSFMLGISTSTFGADRAKAPRWQYRHQNIRISLPSADEPVRAKLSIERAERYLRDGAIAWRESRGCIACHTTGLYQTIRPALTPRLGPRQSGGETAE